MKIKLKTGETIPGMCTEVSKNVVEVKFATDNIPSAERTKGFLLLRDNNELLFDSNGYGTIYKKVNGGYQLSNDGSVYVPEEVLEPIPDYVPTLEELRAAKKQEVGADCERIIYAGVDVALSGGTEHFSLTEKDQINLFGKQAQLTAGSNHVEYHQDGHPCRYYTAAEMQQIIEAAMWLVSYHTTYCNSLNMWIAAASEEELDEIYYGADVPEEYQSEVLKDYLIRIANSVNQEVAADEETV